MTVYCNDPLKKQCRWSGTSEELVCTDADPTSFEYYPQCEGTDFSEEEDEDESVYDDDDDDDDDERRPESLPEIEA